MTRSSAYKTSAVEAYVSAGYTLFPCRGFESEVKERKKPAKIGWRDTKYSASLSAEDLPDIFGVLAQPDDFILDYDPDRDEPGRNQMVELLRMFNIPTPLNTLIVQSGSGGRHIYMKCPPGRKYKMFVPGFPAIEVKSWGRYVIGAGSLYDETGTMYEFYRGTPDLIMQAPEALLDYCEGVDRNIGGDIIDDSQANKDRFSRYCATTRPAVEGHGGDNATFLVALTGRDFGLSEESTFDLMWEYFNPRCSPPWEQHDLRKKVANAYQYSQNSAGSKSLSINAAEIFSQSELNKLFSPSRKPKLAAVNWDFVTINGVPTNKPKPVFQNAVNYFLVEDGIAEGIPNPLKDLIGVNEISGKIEFLKMAPWHTEPKQQWEDSDTVSVKYYLHTQMNFPIASEPLEEAIQIVAKDNSFNPITDWLESIKWDGKSRLDKWLTTYGGAKDSPYTRFVGLSIFLSAVARAYVPGEKVDTMAVFEGPQGIYKSTAVAILGGDYSADIQLHVTTETDKRRTISNTLGKWIVEVSEMQFTKNQDVQAVRSFMTTKVDTVLLPYARHSRDIKRRYIFIGTFNPPADGKYLNDTSGNRRFYPVPVKLFKIADLYEDREQLFAEAVVMYKKGEKWYTEDKDLLEMIAKEQDARTVQEFWAEVIEERLNDPEFPKDEPITNLFIARILGISSAKLDHYATIKIGNAMRQLGYESKATRIKGHPTRVWEKKDQSDA